MDNLVCFLPDGQFSVFSVTVCVRKTGEATKNRQCRDNDNTWTHNTQNEDKQQNNKKNKKKQKKTNKQTS